MPDLATMEPASGARANPFRWQVVPSRDATEGRKQEQYDRIPERTDESSDDTANVAEQAKVRMVSMADISATPNLEDMILRAVDAFSGAIQIHLREDREDALESGDPSPGEAAIESCMQLVKLIAPVAAMNPAIRRAAFSEDDGSVSFVLQSLVTDRRVSYRIDANGRSVNILAIDEQMHPSSLVALLTDTDTLKEKAEWVAQR